MELHGTKTSPFTRIVRIIAAEMNFDLPLRVKGWRTESKDIYQLNPAGRIPVLVDQDRRICDSRTISNYLMEHKQARPSASARLLLGPTRWDEENILCMIYGSLESLAILSYFRDPPEVSHPYIERNHGRIQECFSALDAVAERGFLVKPASFGLAEAALITSIDIIQGRSFANLDAYNNVRAIHAQFADRASVLDTKPDFSGR